MRNILIPVNSNSLILLVYWSSIRHLLSCNDLVNGHIWIKTVFFSICTIHYWVGRSGLNLTHGATFGACSTTTRLHACFRIALVGQRYWVRWWGIHFISCRWGLLSVIVSTLNLLREIEFCSMLFRIALIVIIISAIIRVIINHMLALRWLNHLNIVCRHCLSHANFLSV